MTKTTWIPAAVFIAVTLAGGCSGKTGREKTAHVSGQIKYAGKPVTEGRVIFYPEDGRRMASGAIDASGNYALTTFENQDGAFLGKHKVVINAVHEMTPGPKSAAEEGQVPEARSVRLVPAIFADQKTTTLDATVNEQDNMIDFDIPK